ncbi:hypothetical protein [Ramlibacter algicola]|uniref:Uncharacterized protein n=1 Tax=Ramlibacter algicola TaxID=2795217 RepID=A0A934Q1M6_9BURK|nr:hypothetical protein [Ramlibacter algicola]MBK0394384.1 hypothetical protein [Ramlibacter algicola]
MAIDSGYATARAQLLRTGWKADRTWGEAGVGGRRTYPRYPEVLCGHGRDAVCTGRFHKAGHAILVMINPRSKALPVTSIDED